MSSTTNSLNSSLTMTQSYNNTGINHTTSPNPTLKAKFQIGSVHGRIDFHSDERVFHPADMPEKAKQARESVEELLKTHILTVNKPHWDATSTAGPNRSGMRRAPWDNDGWDDRHYNKIQTQYLVDKAKHRIDCIRRGEDPDPDPNVIQPRWNVSTYVEPPRALLLSTGPNKGPNDTAAATSKNPYYNSQYVATLKSRSQQSTTLDALGHMDTARRTQQHQQHTQQRTKNITFLPQDYQSLVKKQTTLNETRRKEKEKERIAAARAAHLSEQWSHASDPDFTFTATLDEDDDILGRAAEERQDSLQTFIQQQQAVQEQQQSSPSRTHDLRRTRPSTMSHIKHTKKTATITSLNAPSTAPSQAPQPAWSRLAHKKHTLSHTLVPKPYIHHGTMSPDRIRAQPMNNSGLQSTTGVVGARVQQYVHEGVYAFSPLENSHVWSCCMQSSHDARGCSMRLVSDATHWNVESA